MEEIYIFGHKNPDTDSILSSLVLEAIERTMGVKNAKAYRLGEINKETKFVLEYFGIGTPALLEEVEEGREVMLVDHNEFSQSVKGIEKAKILRVIDHHKIANFETHEPLFYLGMPVGCTATILYEMCKASNIPMDRITAGLIISSIISDTLLLKSPTTTEKDRNAVKELTELAELNVEEYGMKLLKAGTDYTGFTAEDLINIDSKTSATKGVKYQVAQINTVSIGEILNQKEEIEKAMENYMQINNIDLYILMITDILESNSQIIVLGKQEIAEKAFGVKLEDNMAFLEKVVSRKKQVVPNIEKAIG